MISGSRCVEPPNLTLSSEANRVLISVNPKAGRRSAAGRVDRLTELLGKHGFQVDVFTDLAEVSGRANQFHAEGKLRALVGVGGDGTAAELVNRTDHGVPITLLAAGTANLLSKHFRLSGKPDRLCRTIANGKLLRLDAGRASGRLFISMVGCGFDAEVVQRVHTLRESNPKGAHIGYASYLKPILKSIRSYGYPEIRVYCESGEGAEEEPDPIVARWVFALNLPRYGWGIPLAPKAMATDGVLDLCTFSGRSLMSGMKFATFAQLGGRHPHLAGCQMRRGRRFRVTSEEPVPYQLDGDPGGVLPIEVEVLPQRLTLLAPGQ